MTTFSNSKLTDEKIRTRIESLKNSARGSFCSTFAIDAMLFEELLELRKQNELQRRELLQASITLLNQQKQLHEFRKPKTPAQPVIPERLIQAINRLLDNDGSRGCFDALEQHRAKTELELLLAAAQQNEPQNIPAQPVSELRARAILLYKPPFKFDFGYIWDADGQMVADQKLNEDGQILRVRGWGRISYLENPEALQDEVGEIIAIALSDYWNRNIEASPAQEIE